ncbi:MAG: EamA family transporter [Lachnospiraceae bacterium]|nr:EamA family transporter [Lachnospiraceae bacterium]
MIYYVLMLVMTLCGSIGSLFLKKATGHEKFLYVIVDKFFYIGTLVYLAGAVINIYILRYIDYSVALPFTAFTYVWTIFIARAVLKEKISLQKIIGIILVIIGAILVAI